MDTILRETTLSLSFCLPTEAGDQLLKRRICSLMNKFFLLRVDFILEGIHRPGKQTVTKVAPRKMAEKHGAVPVYLNPTGVRLQQTTFFNIFHNFSEKIMLDKSRESLPNIKSYFLRKIK